MATRGGGAPAGAALVSIPQVPADSRTVLTGIAVNPALDDAQRTVLAQAVARVDAGVQTPAVREAVLQQIEGLGTYFRKTSSDTFPRWAVLTALRVYGLNLESKAAAPVTPAQTEVQVVANVRASLENVARQGGVSLGQALVVAKAAAPVVAQVARPVEVTDSGSDESERGARVELVA
ncbi:MAG: hypothetical protein EBR79_02515 [Proteobacteria bacterium]|nr:hypothetical protein [Pseudomonadota bacterium]